ncbi:hypothetical protein JXM83_06040 [Candidatus Woesearchaeota archaeon]|nr:hypothetical protein [Candidatus Woesearchaeota archaeon]
MVMFSKVVDIIVGLFVLLAVLNVAITPIAKDALGPIFGIQDQVETYVNSSEDEFMAYNPEDDFGRAGYSIMGLINSVKVLTTNPLNSELENTVLTSIDGIIWNMFEEVNTQYYSDPSKYKGTYNFKNDLMTEAFLSMVQKSDYMYSLDINVKKHIMDFTSCSSSILDYSVCVMNGRPFIYGYYDANEYLENHDLFYENIDSYYLSEAQQESVVSNLIPILTKASSLSNGELLNYISSGYSLTRNPGSSSYYAKYIVDNLKSDIGSHFSYITDDQWSLLQSKLETDIREKASSANFIAGLRNTVKMFFYNGNIIRADNLFGTRLHPEQFKSYLCRYMVNASDQVLSAYVYFTEDFTPDKSMFGCNQDGTVSDSFDSPGSTILLPLTDARSLQPSKIEEGRTYYIGRKIQQDQIDALFNSERIPRYTSIFDWNFIKMPYNLYDANVVGYDSIGCTQYLDANMRRYCFVSNFELPENDVNEDLKGDAVKSFLKDIATAYKSPKYVFFYESMPDGEENAWGYDVSTNILKNMMIGGLLNSAFDVFSFGKAAFSGMKNGIQSVVSKKLFGIASGAATDGITKEVAQEIEKEIFEEVVEEASEGAVQRVVMESVEKLVTESLEKGTEVEIQQAVKAMYFMELFQEAKPQYENLLRGLTSTPGISDDFVIGLQEGIAQGIKTNGIDGIKSLTPDELMEMGIRRQGVTDIGSARELIADDLQRLVGQLDDLVEKIPSDPELLQKVLSSKNNMKLILETVDAGKITGEIMDKVVESLSKVDSLSVDVANSIAKRFYSETDDIFEQFAKEGFDPSVLSETISTKMQRIVDEELVKKLNEKSVFKGLGSKSRIRKVGITFALMYYDWMQNARLDKYYLRDMETSDSFVLYDPTYPSVQERFVQFDIGDDSQTYVNINKPTDNRFYLASPCKADVMVTRDVCSCEVRSGNFLLKDGDTLKPVQNVFLKTGSIEQFYLWDQIKDSSDPSLVRIRESVKAAYDDHGFLGLGGIGNQISAEYVYYSRLFSDYPELKTEIYDYFNSAFEEYKTMLTGAGYTPYSLDGMTCYDLNQPEINTFATDFSRLCSSKSNVFCNLGEKYKTAHMADQLGYSLFRFLDELRSYTFSSVYYDPQLIYQDYYEADAELDDSSIYYSSLYGGMSVRQTSLNNFDVIVPEVFFKLRSAGKNRDSYKGTLSFPNSVKTYMLCIDTNNYAQFSDLFDTAMVASNFNIESNELRNGINSVLYDRVISRFLSRIIGEQSKVCYSADPNYEACKTINDECERISESSSFSVYDQCSSRYYDCLYELSTYAECYAQAQEQYKSIYGDLEENMLREWFVNYYYANVEDVDTKKMVQYCSPPSDNIERLNPLNEFTKSSGSSFGTLKSDESGLSFYTFRVTIPCVDVDVNNMNYPTYYDGNNFCHMGAAADKNDKIRQVVSISLMAVDLAANIALGIATGGSSALVQAAVSATASFGSGALAAFIDDRFLDAYRWPANQENTWVD